MFVSNYYICDGRQAVFGDYSTYYSYLRKSYFVKETTFDMRF